jgi:hypothetical protein
MQPLRPFARVLTSRIMAGLVASWHFAVLIGLTACAQIQITSQSAAPQRPVYELTGATPDHLKSEAARLCPQGFDILRQSTMDTRQPGDYRAIQWWNQALSWVEDDNRQTQMVVSCKVT